jgi:hypothetical protein
MIEKIKKEVYYYTGHEATDDEALEILDFKAESPNASLDEIIKDYYGG